MHEMMFCWRVVFVSSLAADDERIGDMLQMDLFFQCSLSLASYHYYCFDVYLMQNIISSSCELSWAIIMFAYVIIELAIIININMSMGRSQQKYRKKKNEINECRVA